MANYTSQLAKRRSPQQALNTEAIGFVLQSKEEKWNANQAKIDATLSQLGSIDLYRDKDKEHLLNNVETLLGNISNVGSLDLSSDTVSRGLQTAITSSIDDYTIDQVVNTRKIKKFGTDVQQIKEKNPELYNDGNYAYALEKSGMQSYISGESDNIGELAYTPYTDVNAKVQKGIKDLREYNKETEIEIPINDNGIRRILTKKVKDLNEVELRGYVMSQMGSQERTQLQIDGWRDFQGYSDDQVSGLLEESFKAKTKNIDSNISLLKEAIKNAPEWKAQDLQNRVNILNQEKSYIEDNLTTQGKSRTNLERMYKEQELIDQVTRANLDVDTTYSMGGVDDAYYKAEKLKIDLLTAEAKAKPTTTTPLGEVTDPYNNPQIGVIAAEAIDTQEKDPLQIIEEEVQKQRQVVDNSYSNNIKPQLEALPPESKKAWEDYKAQNADKSKSERELFQEYSSKTGYDPSYVAEDGSTRLFSQDVADATDVMATMSGIIETSVNEKFDANIDDVYREAKSQGALNSNEFLVVNEDGSTTTTVQLLDGITPEEFKDNKNGVRDKVKKNLYKNKAFSILLNIGRGNTNSDPRLNRADNYAGIVEDRKFNEAEKYLKLSGETKTFTDYFNITDPITGEEMSREDFLDNKGVKGRLEAKSDEARQWTRSLFSDNLFTDTTVQSDSKTNRIISDMKDSGLQDRLQENFYTFSQNALYIRPNLDAKSGGNTLGDIHNKVADAVTSSSIMTGVPIKVDRKVPFIIQEDPESPDYVIIRQAKEEKLEGYTVVNPKVGVVLKQDIEKSLGFKLQTRKNSEIVNNIPEKNENVMAIDDSSVQGSEKVNAIVDMALKGDLPIDPASLILSKKDMRNFISDQYSYEADRTTRTESYQLANAVINRPDKLAVEYRPKGQNGYVVVYNRETGEEIKPIMVNNPSDIRKYRRLVKYAPQQFIGVALKEMMVEKYNDNDALFNKFLKTVQ